MEQSELASLKESNCYNCLSFHNLFSFDECTASVVQPNSDFIELVHTLAYDYDYADFTVVYFKMPWFNDFE